MENEKLAAATNESQQGVEGLLAGPVHVLPQDEGRVLDDGIGLCLSGGGYRAMLFHAGVLWRLNDIGWLSKFARISSVSGGSIAAGVLASRWDSLKFKENVAADFEDEVIRPIMGLASRTIDIPAVLKGLFLKGGASKFIAGYYRKHLFGDMKLKEISRSAPFFVINSTSVQSGVLCRFTRHYMWDYRVGKIASPSIDIATAVAASSAFPPVLSPTVLDLSPDDFVAGSGTDMEDAKYRSRVVLTDGGVYDNLGLETVWKNYRTVLVSDAGGSFSNEARPKLNWLSHSYRTLSTIDNQVRSLRKRQVVDSFVAQVRNGSYWSIRTDLAKKYRVPSMLDCPFDRTTALANIGTRLAKLDRSVQEKLINWGYALTDCAVRKFVDDTVEPAQAFPFPTAGV